VSTNPSLKYPGICPTYACFASGIEKYYYFCHALVAIFH